MNTTPVIIDDVPAVLIGPIVPTYRLTGYELESGWYVDIETNWGQSWWYLTYDQANTVRAAMSAAGATCERDDS